MTVRQVYEAALIEMNKLQAPSLLLEDYNYFINKAILNYVNYRYNLYDAYQQSTDDLRVLKGTQVVTGLTPLTGTIKLHGATYEGELPRDYFHILNCIVEYDVVKPFKCYVPGDPFYQGAFRLTADMYNQIINNHYMRPSYKRPYFYIHNQVEPTVDTNPMAANDDVPEIETDNRYGNSSGVKIQIRYGKDNSLFRLTKVLIDYLKVPRHVRLTQQEIDKTEDLSSVMEFPDYVCQEIIKELVKLIMENSSDPRLQTNPPINQVIANPPSAQPEDQGGRRR